MTKQAAQYFLDDLNNWERNYDEQDWQSLRDTAAEMFKLAGVEFLAACNENVNIRRELFFCNDYPNDEAIASGFVAAVNTLKNNAAEYPESRLLREYPAAYNWYYKRGQYCL